MQHSGDIFLDTVFGGVATWITASGFGNSRYIGGSVELSVKQDSIGADWKKVSKILERVGMAWYEPEVHRKAFEASHTVVFVYHSGQLIGFGRAISDGVYPG